ncbi:MAG: paraquat-inducible protein A [Thiogranum sp.]|nr:paraquat-inducible protein A [Thiogranum sp.]
MQQARDFGMTSCHTCELLVRVPSHRHAHCPRCGAQVHLRKRYSIGATWAFLIAAMLMYLPANLLPVMTTVYLGSGQPDTIMSGVILLFLNGEWPLALIVFVASILIPLLKMIALTYLLISVQRRSSFQHRHRARLYRVTELVGRWSMVDIFVVALLVALVQVGSIASVYPGAGARAFAAVVILTMLAAMSFDPRLIWDEKKETGGRNG